MATAAGVTPGIRAAWPSVAGRTRSSFSRISRESPGMLVKPNSAGICRRSAVLQALDLALLLRDVAVVLDLGLDGRRARRAPAPRPDTRAPTRRSPAMRVSGRFSHCAVSVRRQAPPADAPSAGCFASNSRPALVASPGPARRPMGVSRSSALSMRRCRRNSAREVNMRYGSSAPLVIRSSIRIPV